MRTHGVQWRWGWGCLGANACQRTELSCCCWGCHGRGNVADAASLACLIPVTDRLGVVGLFQMDGVPPRRRRPSIVCSNDAGAPSLLRVCEEVLRRRVRAWGWEDLRREAGDPVASTAWPWVEDTGSPSWADTLRCNCRRVRLTGE